ncbi:MAG: cell division protein SepF [Candidatus Aenigmatarchaeota archaeon]
MVIKKIVEKLARKDRKKEEVEEEEVEIVTPEEERKEKVYVLKLRDFNDTYQVQNLLREGYIVVLSIKELRMKDVSELKRSVDRIKKTVEAIGGDIVGVEEDLIIATPSGVKIER